MKIAVVHPYLNYFGGAEQVISNIVNVLSEEHEIELFSFAFSDIFLGKLQREVTLTKVPSFSLIEKCTVGPFDRWTVRAYLNVSLRRPISTDADIINYHNVPAFWMVSGHGKKIWMCQEPQRAFYDSSISLRDKIPLFLIPGFRALMRILVLKDKLVVEKIDKILVNSELSRKLIFRIYKKDSEVLHLPVVPDWTPSSQAVEKIRSKYSPSGNKIILMVGGVEPTKGGIDAIKTLRTFLQNGDISLVIEGNHAFSSKIKSKIQQLGVHETVFLPGRIQNIEDFYQAADFILINAKFEPFGLSAIESMFLGKIALVSKRAGASKIINSGINGFVFSDSAELRKIMFSLIRGYYNLDEIGRNAKKTIMSRCSQERFETQLKEIFKDN